MSDERWRALEENTAALGNARSGPAPERTALLAMLDAFRANAGGIPIGTRELQFSPARRALLSSAIPGEADQLLGYKIGSGLAVPDSLVALLGPGGVLKGWMVLSTGEILPPVWPDEPA